MFKNFNFIIYMFCVDTVSNYLFGSYLTEIIKNLCLVFSITKGHHKILLLKIKLGEHIAPKEDIRNQNIDEFHTLNK